MTQQHPIIPPPELVVEWADTIYQQTEDDDQRDLYVAARAAQWGADQELEACCAFAESQPWGLVNGPHVADVIRAARRPKPPSLKEQALDELHISFDRGYLKKEAADTIRRALEQLPDA
jgi:hypothetical protein